jgi:hypothetical protein
MISNPVIIGCIVSAIALAVALYFLMKKDLGWTDERKKQLLDFFNDFPLDKGIAEVISHYKDCLVSEFTSKYSYDDYNNSQKTVILRFLQETTCFGKKGKWDDFIKNFLKYGMTTHDKMPLDCVECLVNNLENSYSPNILFDKVEFEKSAKLSLLACMEKCGKK